MIIPIVVLTVCLLCIDSRDTSSSFTAADFASEPSIDRELIHLMCIRKIVTMNAFHEYQNVRVMNIILQLCPLRCKNIILCHI